MVLLGCVLAGAPAHAQKAGPADRTRLFARRTALLIENFTRYIDWPPWALPPEGRFTLCLQGGSETAEELANLAAGYRWKKRDTDVRRVRPGDALDGCHVLYLAASERGRLQPVVAAAAQKPILTVSDAPGFCALGVHFNFFPVVREGPSPGIYPHFEWSVPEVRRSALLIAPVLLRQGREVASRAAPGVPVEGVRE